jgi:UDP-N-acetyl-D-glucosamine/UDP-N-acetyl-D-galactosamine dehydrogenase
MIKICVIGLGYVGLPISMQISKRFETIGFDVNTKRIKDLIKYKDTNNEFTRSEFKNKKLIFTSQISEIKSCNFYIICVPTPITQKKIPDLNPLKKSFETISRILKKNDLVILESTVYPGITSRFEDYLEKKTKLISNKDFYLCYSPERINPGDKKNNLTKINKIFAVNTKNKKIIHLIKNIYKNLCKKLIITKSIKEAETAKAIENTQRDINIAIFNEILMICEKLKISFSEVIRLANTKWNFINFNPGLVGGHCLPVDPFYLSHVAKKNKIKTITTLAGRKTNDNMERYVLNTFKKFISTKNLKKNNYKILVVGLSYKYGVADTRNSINLKIFEKIKKMNKKTFGFDPFIDHKKYKSINIIKDINSFDVIIFLSKGKIYENLFKKIKSKKAKVIFDPFYYYKN